MARHTMSALLVRRAAQWVRARRARQLCPQRVVFLHIPKCGGTSLNEAFIRMLGPARFGQTAALDSSLLDHAGGAWVRHARRARYAYGHFGADVFAALDGEAVSFTCLRDPFARVLSALNFVQTHQGGRQALPVTSAEDAFTSDRPGVRDVLDNLMTRQLAVSSLPERARAVPRDEWVGRAVETLRKLDHIGWIDDQPALLEQVRQSAGITTPMDLKVENRTQTDSGGAWTHVRGTDALRALAEPLIELDNQVIAAARGF